MTVFPNGAIDSDEILIYLDGNIQSLGTLAGGPQIVDTNLIGNSVLGSQWDLSPVHNAPLGAWSVYDRELSPALILDLYQNP